VWKELAALDQSTRWYIERLESFSQHHGDYLHTVAELNEKSRALVGDLRQKNLGTAGDIVFRSVQQVLERVRSGTADAAQVAEIARRLDDHAPLASVDPARLDELTTLMKALVPAKRGVEEQAAQITSGRFKNRVNELRDLVTRDHLVVLDTVNDARVLLNVYTVALLLVLGYFGFRLQRNHRELNASHSELEHRVKERTADLEKAYNDLTESQVQLVQAEKMSSLGQLVAGIMHEINTPLLYVINNGEVIARNIDELRDAVQAAADASLALKMPEDKQSLKNALHKLGGVVDPDTVTETLEEIVSLTGDSRDGLHQISELVQSLKDFSRLDRAGEDRFDVREGLEKTLMITRNLLKYGITVEKHFDDVPEVMCAPSRINQVFINLITNAAQAMNGKGTLTLSTRVQDQWVQVSVRDTGCGIPEENLTKVLDPFFTTKPVGQGTGLGLSIVRQIVDEHGGRIDVRSEVGVGTEFVVSLPLIREPVQEAA
jgi:signal transduction histidine kinase